MLLLEGCRNHLLDFLFDLFYIKFLSNLTNIKPIKFCENKIP